MIRKKLQDTIKDLERLRNNTDRAIQELQKVIDGLANDIDAPVQDTPKQAELTPSNGNGNNKTYAEIATELLRDAQRPMHLTDIMHGIEDYKKLPHGSVARPSLHTTLVRYGQRTGLIKKAGPGKFQYVQDNEKAPTHSA